MTENEDRLKKFHDFISGLITDCDDERANLKDLNKEDRDKIEYWLIHIQMIAEYIDETVERIIKRRKTRRERMHDGHQA